MKIKYIDHPIGERKLKWTFDPNDPNTWDENSGYRGYFTTRELIDTANDILEDYADQGYTMTLRQLYYQFVSKNLIRNKENSYNNLGRIMTMGREAGLVSWHRLQDNNRTLFKYSVEEDVENSLKGIEYGINYDKWARQEYYCEVWVEKDALSNVISRAANKYDVPWLACKGYMSASESWRAGQRFESALADGKQCILFHLGDHDPSGLDMTRDNEHRANLFAFSSDVEIRRLALNMNQVEEYSPPPNPAKVTDSRFESYSEIYGDESWELDALEPSILNGLITEAVEELIDFNEWERIENEEASVRKKLIAIRENWNDISEFLNELNHE